MKIAVTLERHSGRIQWISVLAIVAALVALARALPLQQAIGALQGWIEGLGPTGMVVFVLVYVVAALLFVPGSALTLAAGALFGLAWGTALVSVAATTAAALAFLIARYLARERVERRARASPRFGAIDRAIGERGWKIIALLRLSPAVPFSVGNYLFGLTPVRFVPYVLASWIAMLPGTFLYVYLGRLGRAGLEAAGGGGEGRSPLEWTAWIVGLAATAALTVYVTRIAWRALREQTDISAAPAGREKAAPKDEGSPARAAALSLLALAALCAAGLAWWKRGEIAGLFGPPPVEMAEAYERRPEGPDVDHSLYEELLREHVTAEGWVDYRGLREDPAALDRYIEVLAAAPFDELGRDQKLALLINAYNAFTLRLILDHWPVASIKDIPAAERWDDEQWRVGGHTWSLNQIEHQEIRPKFVEPRVHFALVCAAVGCPPLRREAYAAARLEEQLEDQARRVHSDPRWFRFDAAQGAVHLTPLYDWYRGDFEQEAGGVLRYAARYSDELARALEGDREPEVRWLEYDWSLNSLRERP